MFAPTSKTLETANLHISYLEFGNPAGTPLILLHGFPDAPIAWKPVIEGLDQRKFHLFVPYLRGYGGTAVTQPELIAGQEAALGNDLLAFADGLRIERFHLAGHDWGARAAYAACIFAPQRIITLLTLATPYIMYGGKDYPPAQVRGNWYQWYFQLEPGRKVMHENAEAFCHELWQSWSPTWSFSERDFAAAAKAWRGPQFADIVLHYYRTRWDGALGVRAYDNLQTRLNAQPKPKISVPTIYVQGGADACDLPACSEDQASYFAAKYQRVLLKGVGHFPHREAPSAVAKILRKQLES